MMYIYKTKFDSWWRRRRGYGKKIGPFFVIFFYLESDFLIKFDIDNLSFETKVIKAVGTRSFKNISIQWKVEDTITKF